MKIYREQPLGLVRSIIRANGVDEAVRIADDTDHGSAAAVFGREITSARAVARRSQRGICHINDATVADDAQVPLGGMKAGGYGRFGGKAVINEFTDFRWIAIEGRQHYPFRRSNWFSGFSRIAAPAQRSAVEKWKSKPVSCSLPLCRLTGGRGLLSNREIALSGSEISRSGLARKRLRRGVPPLARYGAWS